MSCSASVVPQVFSMSMAQFVSVLDVSDAESDNGIKRGVWSNVTAPTASVFAALPAFGFMLVCLGFDVGWSEADASTMRMCVWWR